MSRRTSSRFGFGTKLTGRGGRDGPSTMGSQSRTNPLLWRTGALRHMLPSAFEEHKAHYDQRPLQCVRCSYVPKNRTFLNDTPEGYICRAEQACAKRAKGNMDWSVEKDL